MKGFTDTFTTVGPGHQILVKRGEIIQYLITGTSGIGTMRLEFTDNHQVWKPAQKETGDANFTGTVTTPITSETLGWITNDSGRDLIFRWRATAVTSGTFTCTLTLQTHIALRLQDTVVVLVDNDAPAGGADGDGASFAGSGSIYIDTSTGKHYRNEGTSAMTNWAAL